MDLLLALILSFLLLLFSSLKGVFIAYPLGLALVAFVGILWRGGYALKALVRYAVQGIRRAFPVLRVLLLIGVAIASWMVLSTAFVGLFAGTPTLDSIQHSLTRGMGHRRRFLTTGLVGTGTAAFGCTQTIAILLAEQLMRSKYEESQKGNMTLALDLENTVVVISPLIPWNIAGLVPATVLSTNAGFIPFACYLYLLPLVNWLHGQLASPTKPQLCN